MNMFRLQTLAFTLLALMCGAARAQSGGPYQITSYTIDGGGVLNASGGVFTLSGTVGQPDAGPALAGGAFEVSGGFWPTAIATNTCPADLAAPFGVLNFFDLNAYLTAYNTGNFDIADISPSGGDGLLNFFDLNAYLTLYNAGCP